jgi:hypothetical protein
MPTNGQSVGRAGLVLELLDLSWRYKGMSRRRREEARNSSRRNENAIVTNRDQLRGRWFMGEGIDANIWHRLGERERKRE